MTRPVGPTMLSSSFGLPVMDQPFVAFPVHQAVVMTA